MVTVETPLAEPEESKDAAVVPLAAELPGTMPSKVYEAPCVGRAADRQHGL